MGVEKLWTPSYHAEEFPERRNDVTKEEVQAFEADRAAEKTASKGDGFGFGDGAKSADDEKRKAKEAAAKEALAARKAQMVAQEEATKARTVALSGMTDLERQWAEMREVELKFERERLKEKIERTVSAFDEALSNLRREEFKLVSDLKAAELKMLTLH